jgi:hypothetical protein
MTSTWRHIIGFTEQSTFTSVVLRLCLVSNLFMMGLFVHFQFSEDPPPLPLPASTSSARCPPPQPSKTHGFVPLGYFRTAYPHATDPSDPEPLIRISSWTELQPGVRRWFREGSEQFRRCPNLHSWMQCSYQMIEDPKNASDVLLFHARHLRSLPERRLPHQKWVFYEVEAPTNVWNKVDAAAPFWELFNITATFSAESDVPYRLHAIECRRKQNYTAPSANYAQGKRGKVAWFVSHCSTSSRRELYAEELGKYIDVDVYGGCGNQSVCGGGHLNKNFSAYDCLRDFISANYKFYLSFENAFCREYVTEKLHGILAINVIPIVMGSADYTNMLPRGTYVDVSAYASPKDLAAYLSEIDRSDEMYNAFIRCKFSHECRGVDRVRFHCKLCEYLHLHRYERQHVHHAQRFWSVRRRCTPPHEFYRGVAEDVIPKIQYSQRPDLFL